MMVSYRGTFEEPEKPEKLAISIRILPTDCMEYMWIVMF